MALKYLIVCACILPFISCAIVPVLENNKIKISTMTGAFCPWTVDFVSNYLVPTYESFKDHLEIEFVAWGSATLNADGTVTCSRGPIDCWANRLQRCVLDILKDDQDAQVKFMACEFGERAGFLRTSYSCVDKVGLRSKLVDIDYCVQNPQLDDLDEKAAALGADFITDIGGIPAVRFNDVFNQTLYNEARGRLYSLVCFSLSEVPELGITGCPVGQP